MFMVYQELKSTILLMATCKYIMLSLKTNSHLVYKSVLTASPGGNSYFHKLVMVFYLIEIVLAGKKPKVMH